METNFNIGSLKIVSAPLMEHFKKIQANLNDNIQLINDKKIPSNFESIDVIRKVSGTLKMLGLTGVNRVLFSVNSALEQVKGAKFDTNKSLAVLEASSEIVTSVVFYLENLLKGEQDQSTKLFDEYQKINNLLGVKVSVKDLFTPKLEFRKNAVTDLQYALRLGVLLKADSKEKISSFLNNSIVDVKSAVAENIALLDANKFTTYEEKETYQNVIKNLYTVAENIQNLNLSKNVYLVSILEKLFISIISPVFNDGFTNLAEENKEEIKTNLNAFVSFVEGVHSSLEKLSLNDKTGGIKVSEETVCNLLYFILNVMNDVENVNLKSMPVYQELTAVFDIDFYANQLTNTSVEVSLSQSNPEAAIQIDKLFVEMKEELSLLTSKQASVDTFFQQHSAKFLSNSNKLNDLMANVATPRWKELNELVSSVLLAIKNKEYEFSEVLQKEVSLSLVIVEYGINNFVKHLLNASQKADFEFQATLQINRLEAAKSNRLDELASLARPSLDAGSQKADERKSMLIIFDKLSKDLKKSEEILNDIFRDPTNTEDLPVVFKTLNSAKGIFAIIKKTEFSEILTEVIAIWKEVGENGIDIVNKEDLASSVKLLSGILLYAEATKNDNEIEANEIFHRVMLTRNKGQDEVGATFVLPGENVVIEDAPLVEEVAIVEESPLIEEVVIAQEDPVEFNVDFSTSIPVVVSEVVETEAEAEAEVPFNSVSVDVPEYIDQSEDDELLEVYLMEAEEVLENITGSLATLSNNSTDAEELANIRRYFHTLKGSGRMVGLQYLGEAGWMVEQTLNKIVSGDLTLNAPILAELESIRKDFVTWTETIKETKQVKVDLVGLKQKWLAVNPSLMTKIEIPDVATPVAPAFEDLTFAVIPEPVVEETPEAILEEAPIEEVALDLTPESVVQETQEIDEFTLELTPDSVVQETQEIEEFVFDENTPAIEVVAEPVEPVVFEETIDFIVDDEVETNPELEVREFININGVDVTESLYNIYKEETEGHLRELRESVQSYDGSDEGFEITYDFMRHAHTLGSIAKSVNMDVFAEFVVKIEFVANTCLDRKLLLKGEQFNVLKSSVENLDLFSNIIDGSLEHNQHFLALSERLQKILNFLTSVEEVDVSTNYDNAPLSYGLMQDIETKEENLEKNVNNEVVSSVNVEKAVDDITSKVSEVLDEKFNSLDNKFVSLSDRLDEVSQEISQEINQEKSYAQSFVSDVTPATPEDLEKVNNSVKAVTEDVESAVAEHFQKIAKQMEETEKSHAQEVKTLKEEVSELKQEIEKLQKEQHESFDELKRYMRHLNSAIKKKSNLTNSGVVRIQQEEQEPRLIENALETPNELPLEVHSEYEEISASSGGYNYNSGVEEVVTESVNLDFVQPEPEVKTLLDENVDLNLENNLNDNVTDVPVEFIAEEVAVAAVEEAPVEVVTEEVAVETVEETPVEAVTEEVAVETVEEAPVEVVTEEVAVETVEEVSVEVVTEEVAVEAIEEAPVEAVTEEVAVEAIEEAPEFNLDFTIPSERKEEIAPVVVTGVAGFFAANPFVKTIYEDKISSVSDELDDELLEIAQMETDELMEQIDNLLEGVQSPVLNLEQNNELKRNLHTLKGSVRMAGANRVGAIAHRLESLLEYSETRGISLFTMKELLEEEMKKVSFLLKNVRETLPADKILWIDGGYEAVAPVEIKTVESLASNEIAQTVNQLPSQQVHKKEERQSIRIDAQIIDDLINNAGEVRLTRTTLEGMLISNRRSLTDLKASSDKLSAMLKEIEVQAETQISAKKELAENDENFDPLEFDRFTRLQELTRFMNEAVADVQDTVASMESFLKTQDGAIVQQSNLTNNLLDTLMKVRLVPVDTISDRLYKITRNTAKELGKRVNLELHGEKTEIDRLVLDKVISPIEHLLRNSIAHGIELPEDRTASKKPVAGKVVFNITVDGNFIMLTIKDDGAGINIDKVRAVAIKKGLLKMGVDYTEKQITEMIFQSGFSTADTVSQVAGRGVGMDVVKKEISELGGSIEISTERGQGTEFKVILPVSVATNHVMLTSVSDKLIGIPALNVEEVFSLKRAQIQKAYQEGKVELKGKEYSLYYLGHLLGLIPANQLPEFRTYNTLIAVNYLGDNVIVHIDELEATTEVLIKSMGTHYSKISGVLGATLLGDGRQGLIVNPVSLKNHYEQNIKLNKVNDTEFVEEDTEKSGVITVMVVDDSITVRRATSKVLQRYGYNVVLAKDGEDGLEQLQVVIPDIILSDIEMPRMDGFEFAKNVKNTEKYANIPIIMITSRTADKHKNYAYSLGVEGFLGKPYQEEELIANITELTQKFKH